MQHETAAHLIETFLDDPHAAWSLGTFGAIAEFMREPDEAVTGNATTRITARGAISIDPKAGFQIFAHEKTVARRTGLEPDNRAVPAEGRGRHEPAHRADRARAG